MSAADTAIVNKPKPAGLPLQLWLSQIAAIMRPFSWLNWETFIKNKGTYRLPGPITGQP